MRESIGNVFFFGTYEITRSYLFSCFGLDASRRSKAALGDAEPVSMQASFSDALLETGIGIVTGGLAGTVFWLSVLPLDVAKTRIQTAIDLNVNRNPFYQIRLVSYAIDCPANPFQHCTLGLMPQVTQFFGCAGLQASWSESPVCRDRSYFGSSIPSQCCCNCDMGVDCSIVEY
jgi:solute carrier family 25 carnitine/acylcarnitine transporter 20/29